MLESAPLFATGHYKALVIGSSGAIGNAFAQAFLADSQCTHVERVCRSAQSDFDITHQESISAQATLSNVPIKSSSTPPARS